MTGSEEDSRRLARFAGQLASPRSSTDREFYTRRRRLVLPTLAGKAGAPSELAVPVATIYWIKGEREVDIRVSGAEIRIRISPSPSPG